MRCKCTLEMLFKNEYSKKNNKNLWGIKNIMCVLGSVGELEDKVEEISQEIY